MRFVRRILTAFVVLVLVVIVATVGLLASITARSLPQVNGNLQVAGLQGSVTVIRDAAGVAQIYADSPHDLFMAQIERFAREVLPILQAHEVKTVPAAEEVLA